MGRIFCFTVMSCFISLLFPFIFRNIKKYMLLKDRVDFEVATGEVTQVIGPVVDIGFAGGPLPKVYNALLIRRRIERCCDERPSEGFDVVTCEVQQLLGGREVRAVAMTSTDGLRRGSAVVDTGSPIKVPVGQQTLGRIF